MKRILRRGFSGWAEQAVRMPTAPVASTEETKVRRDTECDMKGPPILIGEAVTIRDRFSFPNSCLGTHSSKLCFEAPPETEFRKPAFPNRSLGTRLWKRNLHHFCCKRN